MGKVEESNLHLGDLEAFKRRLTAENADVLRQLQELQNNASLLTKTRAGLVSSLDEAKGVADHEAKERVSLLGKYRNLEHELDGLKQAFDEEVGAKDNVSRQVAKAQGDADMWRQKYEIDGMAKAEELTMAQLKLQARLSESQNMIDQLQMKLSNMEKKAKQCDRIVGEWKAKVDGLSMDLDGAQNETRSVSSELFKVKNAYDEAMLQLDEVRRENKTLSNEIKDILDQITEGGRSIHEIDKIRKRLEAEKMELEA